MPARCYKSYRVGNLYSLHPSFSPSSAYWIRYTIQRTFQPFQLRSCLFTVWEFRLLPAGNNSRVGGYRGIFHEGETKIAVLSNSLLSEETNSCHLPAMSNELFCCLKHDNAMHFIFLFKYILYIGYFYSLIL